MVTTKTQGATVSESHAGTCPVCHQSIVIVNYCIERGRELGYLGRHGRPGLRDGYKCRGSFGYWEEKQRG